MSDSPPDSTEEFRFGFVGLAGVPNVGKSTLMNRLIGTKISIMTHCPQTTRHRICGILTDERMQIVFVDMPGILATENRFNMKLVDCAREAVAGCDLILHLRDAATVGGADDTAVIEVLKSVRKPIHMVWNKCDSAAPEGKLAPHQEALPYAGVHFISGRSGEGLEDLMQAVRGALPAGPALYPADDLSDRDMRFLAAEFVREKVFLCLRQEIPYGVAAWTEEWTERENGGTFIRVILQTEREAHKRMILGEKGQMIKRIGSLARPEIEQLCGGRVYLELWVRVKKNWRGNSMEMQRLGLE